MLIMNQSYSKFQELVNRTIYIDGEVKIHKYRIDFHSKCGRLVIEISGQTSLLYKKKVNILRNVFEFNRNCYFIFNGNIDFDIDASYARIYIAANTIISHKIKCNRFVGYTDPAIIENIHMIEAKIFDINVEIFIVQMETLAEMFPEYFDNIYAIILPDSRLIQRCKNIMRNLMAVYSRMSNIRCDPDLLFTVSIPENSYNYMIVEINANHCEFENIKFDRMNDCNIDANNFHSKVFSLNTFTIDEIVVPDQCTKMLKNANKC
jgi:hypothetical protein